MKFRILAIFAILLLTASCRDPHTVSGSSPLETFDALWSTVDSRYCFFAEKDIDWREVGSRYRARITPDITEAELFDLCAAMLAELRDGHVNLISNEDVSYYRRWWTDYPQDFNLRTLQQYYLQFDWGSVSGLMYKVLDEDVAYLRIPSLSTPVSPGSLDRVLLRLAASKSLIIDLRDNGGGLLSNVGTIASRFIADKRTGGYISHKTGPGHTDFSEPYRFYYSREGVSWQRPVVVLINRSCYSAANTLAAFMASLPGVELIGARTGGGGGMPMTYDLPCGWSVRLSASPVYDPSGRCIEQGVDPSEGCEVHCTAEELASGRDAILDFAIARLRSRQHEDL